MDTNEILAVDKAEQVIVRTKKHPIGLVVTYISTGLGIAASLAMLFFALRSSTDIGVPDYILIITFTLVIVMIGVVGYISAYVYKQNELVVTNENIIQVLQFGLFNRQTSQLGLAKIQDVSVDQIGLASSFFGYGTIEIETAGEKSNFKFSYAPDPNRIAKIIIEAHEDFMRSQASHRSSI